MKKNDKVQHLRIEPKIRFRIFDKPYQEVSFLNLFNFSTGKNIKQSEAKPNFDTPCVRYGELYHMYDEVIDIIYNKTNLDKSSLKFSKGNEILLPSAGEDPLDIGRASSLTLKNVAIGRTINILRPLEGQVNSNYASYYINSKLRRMIASLAKGVSISNVYNSDLKKLKMNLPEMIEQEKVSDFIYYIDKKISLLSKKSKNLKLFKKGYKQRLFKSLESKNSIEFELKDILCEVVKKTSYSNQYEVLSSTTSGIYKQSDYFKSEIASKDNTGYKILKRNQFVMSPQNAWMGNYNLNTEIEIGIVSPSYKVFDVDSSISKPLFAELIDTNRFRYDIICSSEQGASIVRRNLNLADFMDIKIKFPSDKTHLNAVESLLDRINNKIKHCECHLKTLKQFKKGLLQKMFV